MIVDMAVYQDGARQPGTVDLASLPTCAAAPGSFAWVGLHDPTPAEFESIRSALGIDPDIATEAIVPHQRPTTVCHDEVLVVVLKTARYSDETETVVFAEIEVFVGRSFVVAVRHGEASELGHVRRHLESRADLLALGPGAVLCGIVDHVIDDYRPVIDGIDNDLSEVEMQVFTSERTNPAERIYKLKREVLSFHRNTEPLVDGLEMLEKDPPPWISDDLGHRFHGLRQRLQRVVARLDSFGSLLSDALAANLAEVGVRQNNDMRTISAWVAIAAIPTVFGGVYGMNFENMPELRSEHGYFVVLGVITTLCLLAYWRLRKSGWLGSGGDGTGS